MSEEQTLEHMQASEYISFTSQEMADELANQGLEEIRKTKGVSFDPVDDAKKLQFVIDFADKKIKQLSEISVKDFLEQESKLDAELQTAAGKTLITLESERPGLASILAGEHAIARTVNIYTLLIAKVMKEKRLLAGQLYGSRMAHNSQVGRMRSVRSVKLTGKDLLDEFTSRAKTLSPEEDLAAIESPHVKRLAPPAEATGILNGHFTPVEDSKESEAEFDMLCEDLD